LERRIRAFHPWPGTFAALPDGQVLKVLAARTFLAGTTSATPGTIVALGKSLDLATGDGVLSVLEVQPPGRNPQRSFEFLGGAGRALRLGDHLNQAPATPIEN
jgi:methionyl-tRNA formyltransferase